jgi:hypothetical protein
MRTAILALAMSVASASASALTLEALLPGLAGAELADIQSGKTATDSPRKVSELKYVPAVREGDLIRSELEANSGSFIIEMAYFVPGIEFSPENRLGLYSELSRISTLSGVTYHSYSKNEREVVLLSDVFAVEKPGSKKAVPEVAPSSVPDTAVMQVHAKDANFGSTWYQLAIDARGSGFLVSLTNSRPQSAMLIRAFDEGALRLRFALVPASGGIYVYSLCAADPGKTAERLVDMFSAVEKRLNAVRGWVIRRVQASAK